MNERERETMFNPLCGVDDDSFCYEIENPYEFTEHVTRGGLMDLPDKIVIMLLMEWAGKKGYTVSIKSVEAKSDEL